MEDNSDTESTEKPRALNLKSIFGLGAAAVVFGINTVLRFMGKGIALGQIIDFFNVWPIALGLSVAVIAVCAAYVVVECNRQKNKTMRRQYDTETDKKRMDELEAEKKKLEQSLAEAKEKISELSIQNARLESKIELLEKEKECIEQNNSRGGERIPERRFLVGGRSGS